MTPDLQTLLTAITEKKRRLDALRPFPPELVKNLDDWFRIELTYSSNAIEGNTLTRQETALVVEKHLTVAGKSVTEHLEATNHAQAYDWVLRFTTKKRTHIRVNDLLDIHRLILQKIDFNHAGRYRPVAVRIAGSTTTFPNPLKVPELMDEFFLWLHNSPSVHPALFAAEAHYKLVRIHPFVDGNGRAARLLMNVMLMQANYPAAVIRPQERKRYIDAIETANISGNLDDFFLIVGEAINRSLDVYLEALGEKPTLVYSDQKQLKIGELAQVTGEQIHTLRFWTKQGLLRVSGYTEGGYYLYDRDMIEQVRHIRHLQNEKRLTLDEIRDALKGA